MLTDELVEKVAKVLKAEIGKAFDAVPLLGDTTSDDWTATGGTLDLSALAHAALTIAAPAIRADEREACAKVAGNYMVHGPRDDFTRGRYRGHDEAATAIRNRP